MNPNPYAPPAAELRVEADKLGLVTALLPAVPPALLLLGFGPYCLLPIPLSAVLVSIDARRAGRSVAYGIGTLLLWLFFLPYYFRRRASWRAPSRFGISLLSMCVFVTVITVLFFTDAKPPPAPKSPATQSSAS